MCCFILQAKKYIFIPVQLATIIVNAKSHPTLGTADIAVCAVKVC